MSLIVEPDSAERYLTDLTPPQREAVMHFEGPLLILAGAGSGKTRVITRRIAYLLHQGVRLHNILAITFTNKASSEMRRRVEALLPNLRVCICTFHSLGVRLMRQYAERMGRDRNFTIYDQTDRNRLVKAALESADVDSTRFTPDRLEGAISKAKNQLITPQKYASTAHDFFTNTVARVYPLYEKKLREANAVDFDDLLMLPARALEFDKELRSELDARFRFVLIDEYQDTNSAQYAIARGLSIDQPNLCVVGDPDQSIYKWRGSDIRNILDFERDFPEARVISLERNYRSTQAIVRAASHLIEHNRQRKRKALRTENPTGKPVTVCAYPSGSLEAEGIARTIRDAVLAKKRSYRDCAVFLRINALSRTLESAFVSQRVPYQIVKGLAFYDRKENRDVLAYLRLLVNPRDDLAFLRVVNEPTRGIGKVSLDHLKAYAAPRELSLLGAAAEYAQISEIRGKAATGLRDFVLLMRALQPLLDAAPAEVVRQVIERSGYSRMLKQSQDPVDQERLANIEELITAAKQFAAENPDGSITDYLASVSLSSDVDGWNENQDAVSVMTLHSAKGLEFPVVFMAAVEEGLLPHERSREHADDLEEERRLAFVGMTRAREELYLSYARQREFRGQSRYSVPSSFLDELPRDEIVNIDSTQDYSSPRAGEWRGPDRVARPGWDDAGAFHEDLGEPRPAADRKEPAPLVSAASLVQGKRPAGEAAYAEGMLVSHETYGVGRVTSVSGYGAMRKIKIRFSISGERTFIAEKAKLTVVTKP